MIEKSFHVSLYPPSYSLHLSFHGCQSCVTALVWPKSMRVFGECWFIDGFQDEFEHGAQELIPKTGYPERALLTVWSAKRSPSPPPIQNRACELPRTRL